MKTTTSLIALLIGLGTAAAIAQDAPPRGEGRQGGPPGGGQRPASPLMAALDANQDGVIDAKEIQNAVAALKKLDKNGDGQLTADELRPQRPAGQGQGRQGGQRPPGGQGQGRQGSQQQNN